MADKKETPREHSDAEARGDTDLVQLVNGSGEVKKLTAEEYEIQKEMLASDGWKVMGEE